MINFNFCVPCELFLKTGNNDLFFYDGLSKEESQKAFNAAQKGKEKLKEFDFSKLIDSEELAVPSDSSCDCCGVEKNSFIVHVSLPNE